MDNQETINSDQNRKITAMPWTGASSDADYDALKGNDVRTSDDNDPPISSSSRAT